MGCQRFQLQGLTKATFVSYRFASEKRTVLASELRAGCLRSTCSVCGHESRIEQYSLTSDGVTVRVEQTTCLRHMARHRHHMGASKVERCPVLTVNLT